METPYIDARGKLLALKRALRALPQDPQIGYCLDVCENIQMHLTNKVNVSGEHLDNIDKLEADIEQTLNSK